MVRLKSYICGEWFDGGAGGRDLVNPSTEELIAETNTNGIDYAKALKFAREVGGPALRSMTFTERGDLLKQMSRVLYAERENLIVISSKCNGATRKDSKFDIDGATGTLATYAGLSKSLGERSFQVDEESISLNKANARYIGQHIRLARPGVAVHINAFNFPAWGTFEKLAVAILAGMPVITKPATSTALLTYEMIRIIVEAKILPPGVLSFVAGPSGDMMDHLQVQDVVAFTGSASTASLLRSTASVVQNSVTFNAEADSLNSAVLAADIEVGDDVWYTFIRNVTTDITQKCGQKCTAIRRIFVPQKMVGAVAEVLAESLSTVVVGNPAADDVTMGPVATAGQLRDAISGMKSFAEFAEIICGGPSRIDGVGAPSGKGFFVAPTLFVARDSSAPIFHNREVFGPCAVILPYDGTATEAARLVGLGNGSLMSSVYSDNKRWLSQCLLELAVWNGRVQLISSKIAAGAFEPGMVLPTLVHGGPGRAGGGEELGGLRGLDLYTNRVAIQGDSSMLKRLLAL